MRRGWDSNPREPLGSTAFRVRPIQPDFGTSPRLDNYLKYQF